MAWRSCEDGGMPLAYPFLVARMEFLEWTPENRLRHPRFVGLRSDKEARDVVREQSVAVRAGAPAR
ncbi:MAG: hypothetical protein JO166_14005 [Deltaproteobacteria bacterium]|nr:hypothetical protein [Deltaproteobacteria bacterium]